jgi:hypothetical protein
MIEDLLFHFIYQTILFQYLNPHKKIQALLKDRS